MNLLLVQHGQAKSEAEDPERGLTEAGTDAAERMARWLQSTDVEVGEIRHSGKRRAEQTAAILAERLFPPRGAMAVPGLKPKDDVHQAADSLRQIDDSVMIVGHLPFLSRLAGLLVAGDPDCEVVRFQYAGVVSLTEHEGRWSVEWMIVPGLVR